MIIARAPFRITLGGGGTDLPAYYEKNGGFVFSMSIDKYIYVLLNPTPVEKRIRLQYLQSEVVDHANQLRHPLAREALLMHGIEHSMEITSIADLPARAGMGSSGSYLVATLAALHAYKREPVSLIELAEEACKIEIDILRDPVGKQDQYMAVFGGMRVLQIDNNGNVTATPVVLPASSMYELIANTHVYYTGIERNSSDILSIPNTAIQIQSDARHLKTLRSFDQIKELGVQILDAIKNENFDKFGLLLDQHWQIKKGLSDNMSPNKITDLYDFIKKEYGVLGGKIIGAGGGGFLMLYCPKDHRKLSAFMESQSMPRLDYTVEYHGAKIIVDFSSSHEHAISHNKS